MNKPKPFPSVSSPTAAPVNAPAKLPSCPKFAIYVGFGPLSLAANHGNHSWPVRLLNRGSVLVAGFAVPLELYQEPSLPNHNVPLSASYATIKIFPAEGTGTPAQVVPPEEATLTWYFDTLLLLSLNQVPKPQNLPSAEPSAELTIILKSSAIPIWSR